MRLLLDTHVLLWWLSDDPALAASHREAIADPANIVMVSSITVAEVMIKSSIGKLEVPADLLANLPSQGFLELPFLAAHASRLAALPLLHRDPLDRMLVAAAQHEDLTFVTVDRRCAEYDVRVLLAPRR